MTGQPRWLCYHRPRFLLDAAMNALSFPVLRLLSHEAFRSGEEIARILGVSRASVCNALAGVADLGVEVQRVRGRGYRLARPLDWLDGARLQAEVGSAFSVTVLDVVDSTNSALLRGAASGAPHRSCLVAQHQTQGRGRRGRAWHSALGGSLTFSVLWRFQQGVAQLSGLSLAVGLALHRAVTAAGLGEATLKWPNDLLHRHRKLGGILVELQGDALGPAVAVIGVGLNVRLGAVKERIDQAATDLESALGEAPSRHGLLVRILAQLEEVLVRFEAEGFAPFRQEWDQAHAYHGRPVALLLPSGERHQGVVEGVADDGALLLGGPGGVRRYASGEISLRPAGGDHAARG